MKYLFLIALLCTVPYTEAEEPKKKECPCPVKTVEGGLKTGARKIKHFFTGGKKEAIGTDCRNNKGAKGEKGPAGKE